MKTAWEKIFASQEIPLSPEETEEAFRELAQAANKVESLQASPGHQHILKLIAEKIRQADKENRPRDEGCH